MKFGAYRCRRCADVVYSRAQHDFRRCTCGHTFVDGGFDYARIGYGEFGSPEVVQVEVAVDKLELFRDWNHSIDRFGRIRPGIERAVVLVGEAPGRNTDPSKPLEGRSGERLESLAGLTKGSLRQSFHVLNILKRWPGRAGRGDAFPVEQARKLAVAMELPGHGPVVLLGKRVAQVCNFKAGYFEWGAWRGRHAVVAPHPSGISTWWNDPANVRLARTFWRSVAKGRWPERVVG